MIDPRRSASRGSEVFLKIDDMTPAHFVTGSGEADSDRLLMPLSSGERASPLSWASSKSYWQRFKPNHR